MPTFRSPWLAAAVTAFCLSLCTAETTKPEELTHHTLMVGSSAGVFANVSPSDVAAATTVWAKELKRKKGYTGPVDTYIFEEPSEIVAAVEEKKVDLLVLLTVEYLRLKDRLNLQPQFVPKQGSRIEEESLLLVHSESGIEDLAALRDKNVLILNDARGTLGRIWLDSLVKQSGFGGLDTFFGRIANTAKYSKTILPVFFRQSDACLVSRGGFELMAELNPQLSRDLRVLSASPPLLPAILCIRPDYRPEWKSALIEALHELHEEPRGQQILNMFKMDRLVPFQESYLQTAQDLLKSYSLINPLVEKEQTHRPVE